jgi:L-rhamnose mutarotase
MNTETMNQTQRFCLTLDLRNDPELIREYLYWHDQANIWPEIPAGIKAAGIRNMEIYRLDHRLFMIIEAGPGFDFTRDMEYLASLPRQKEWEEFVSKFQESLPGEKSAEKWKLMEKIFEL